MSVIEQLDHQFEQHLVEMKPFLLTLSNATVRHTCAAWIRKLCDPTCSQQGSRKNRNVYSTMLLQCLRNGKISSPFNTTPPAGSLNVFPQLRYEKLESEKNGMQRTVPPWVQQQLVRPLTNSILPGSNYSLFNLGETAFQEKYSELERVKTEYEEREKLIEDERQENSEKIQSLLKETEVLQEKISKGNEEHLQETAQLKEDMENYWKGEVKTLKTKFEQEKIDLQKYNEKKMQEMLDGTNFQLQKIEEDQNNQATQLTRRVEVVSAQLEEKQTENNRLKQVEHQYGQRLKAAESRLKNAQEDFRAARLSAEKELRLMQELNNKNVQSHQAAKERLEEKANKLECQLQEKEKLSVEEIKNLEKVCAAEIKEMKRTHAEEVRGIHLAHDHTMSALTDQMQHDKIEQDAVIQQLRKLHKSKNQDMEKMLMQHEELVNASQKTCSDFQKKQEWDRQQNLQLVNDMKNKCNEEVKNAQEIVENQRKEIKFLEKAASEMKATIETLNRDKEKLKDMLKKNSLEEEVRMEELHKKVNDMELQVIHEVNLRNTQLSQLNQIREQEKINIKEQLNMQKNLLLVQNQKDLESIEERFEGQKKELMTKLHRDKLHQEKGTENLKLRLREAARLHDEEISQLKYQQRQDLQELCKELEKHKNLGKNSARLAKATHYKYKEMMRMQQGKAEQMLSRTISESVKKDLEATVTALQSQVKTLRQRLQVQENVQQTLHAY